MKERILKVFLVDEDQLSALRLLQSQLHAGTDHERDYGHRLWRILNDIEAQSREEPTK